MDEILKAIYKTNVSYQARWNTSLANHASMAATAMYLMKDKADISAEKINGEAAEYSKSLSTKRINESFIDIAKLPDDIQNSLLGHDDLQESWQAYFAAALSRNLDSNIQIWLERFGAGLNAAAGHSILRLYFSLTVRGLFDREFLIQELSICFADLASRYCELSDVADTGGETRLTDFLLSHSALTGADLNSVKSGQLMEDRMLILKSLETYQSVIRSISLEYDLIDTLRSLASMATEAPNIGVLHAITVGQALLGIYDIYPSLKKSSLNRGYRDYVIAMVLGYELPNAKRLIVESLTLTEVYKQVVDLRNDHSQKATFSLTHLYERTGYIEFLVAAEKLQATFG